MIEVQVRGSYGETLDEMRKTLGPYVSVMDEKEAAREALETIRALLLRNVNFSDGDNTEGTLCWKDVEGLITCPFDYE